MRIITIANTNQIDKTTLSYAAIFGIKDDLHLEGTEYSWLSSIFYFGWLAWAFPTNYLMQKFPVAKYLAFNIFMWGALLMCQGKTSFPVTFEMGALSPTVHVTNIQQPPHATSPSSLFCAPCPVPQKAVVIPPS